MQVEMVGTGERQHVASSVGATLIAAGLAVEVKPTAEKSKPNLTFAAVRGPVDGDYEYPPSINHYCTTCGLKGYAASQKGTAHESAVVRHCGIFERPDEKVVAAYKELFNQWKSRSRKPQAPKVSAHDTRFLGQFGMKTKEELMAEAQANLILAKR